MLLEFQNFLIHLLYSQKHNQDISGDELHSILSEIDTNQNGQVELDEYLQVIYFFRFSSLLPI